MRPDDLRARVLEAYGGAERWRAARRVEAIVSVRGLLFRAKRQRPVTRMRCSVEVHAPRARLTPHEWRGEAGILDGHAVRIESSAGEVVASRADARKAFRGLRRMLYWDRLDLTYFGGYAFWNYLAFPALLLRDDIAWRERAPELLEGTFPPALPTHCALQRFHFSATTSLLIQHDYTAEVIGRWARGAHRVLEHAYWDRLPYPSHRRVTPRGLAGRPLRGPIVVEIFVHEWRLV